MDLLRQYEFFNPLEIKEPIHVIGVGAIGSHIVEMLVRMGVTNIDIYDFDTVDEHNIPNQMFFETDIEKSKVTALTEQCLAINSNVKINTHEKGWVPETNLNGYVFICVDSIELRKEIATENLYNPTIIAMFDCRMGLKDAQSYAADWQDNKSKDKFLKTMNFTDAEAKEAMPVSACGTSMSVLPTIRTITAACAANWINFVKGEPLKTCILVNAFTFQYTTF